MFHFDGFTDWLLEFTSTFLGFSAPVAMEQVHGSSMGYCINDIKDDKILEEIVITTHSISYIFKNNIFHSKPPQPPFCTTNPLFIHLK